MLQFKLLQMLQISLSSLEYRYGFSKSKSWKFDKSWMIFDLKLKWDSSEEKTIHDSALVLVGFILSLNVLRLKDHMSFKSFI
jgi:hypothetical protein